MTTAAGVAAVRRLAGDGLADEQRRFAPDVRARLFAPLDTADGADALGAVFWSPLLASMPDLERRVDVALAGAFGGGEWLAHTGHFVGTFARPWLGVPATGRPAWLRYGAFERLERGRTVELLLLADVPGLMMQASAWPLAPPLGAPWLTPGPATRDGIVVAGADGAAALGQVEAMIAGLMRFDGANLASMAMRDHWTADFHWYGPAAIGAARGHSDYERAHQGPFLRAFPDRVGGNHVARIGAGDYVASTGWPSIRATHLGGDWLGLAATGEPVTMRVMDWWRAEGGRLAENWVFVDVIDLLRQLGVDAFERMRALRGCAMAGREGAAPRYR